MSRIGKKPIEVPAGVIVSVDPGRVTVSGPKGELRQDVPQRMQIAQDDGTVTVTRPTERGEDRALHGLTRTLIANMVEGVTDGFEKRLEITGVGYRAAMSGTNLELQVGYSHVVRITPREGISFEVPIPTQVIVRGIDKQVVGQTAAEIRQGAPAGAVQGQGHPLRGRVRPQKGREARMSQADDAQAARAAASEGARQGPRHRRAAPPRRVPLEPRASSPSSSTTTRARPSRRRRGSTCRRRSRATRPSRRPRSASGSPTPPRRRVSSPSFSTAAATCTTVASRRSPRARAKED